MSRPHCEPWEAAGGGLGSRAWPACASGGLCSLLSGPAAGARAGPSPRATGHARERRRLQCPSWIARTLGSSARHMRQLFSPGSEMDFCHPALGSSPSCRVTWAGKLPMASSCWVACAWCGAEPPMRRLPIPLLTAASAWPTVPWVSVHLMSEDRPLRKGLAAKNRRPLAVTLPKGVNALSLPSLTELGELVSAHRGSGRV